MLDLLILLSLLCGVLRLSSMKLWMSLSYAALIAVAAWWSLRYAVQLSKPALEALLQSKEALQWVAIGLTADVLVALLLPRRVAWLGRWGSGALQLLTVSLTLPVALFYLLTQLVFTAVGTDFQLLALLFAAAVAVGLPMAAGLCRWLMPDDGLRREAHVGLVVLACVAGLLAAQQVELIYADFSNQNIIMEFISKGLFGIANALLIPDIVLLIFFFVRALVLLVATYRQHLVRRRGGASQLYARYHTLLLSQAPGEAYGDYVIAQFEAAAAKEVNLSRLLTKLGPVLGLIGTLISMSPALVGLSSGDLAGMAYNMQVVFSATVVGLFISAIGLFTQQLKSRWYAQDVSRLEYDVQQRIAEDHET